MGRHGEGKALTKAIKVFVEGENKPMTVRELSERSGISHAVLTVRAGRCTKRRMHENQSCAVFTERDLQPPAHRAWKSEKKYTVRLTSGEVEVLSEVKGRTTAEKEVLEKVKKAIKKRVNAEGIWNAMVRKNGW